MMGNSAMTRSGPCQRRAPRSAIRAIMVPRMVVPVAVSSASTKVFQATPQLVPPDRQPRPQIRSVNTRPKKAVMDQWPSSVMKAPASALPTG